VSHVHITWLWEYSLQVCRGSFMKIYIGNINHIHYIPYKICCDKAVSMGTLHEDQSTSSSTFGLPVEGFSRKFVIWEYVPTSFTHHKFRCDATIIKGTKTNTLFSLYLRSWWMAFHENILYPSHLMYLCCEICCHRPTIMSTLHEGWSTLLPVSQVAVEVFSWKIIPYIPHILCMYAERFVAKSTLHKSWRIFLLVSCIAVEGFSWKLISHTPYIHIL